MHEAQCSVIKWNMNDKFSCLSSANDSEMCFGMSFMEAFNSAEEAEQNSASLSSNAKLCFHFVSHLARLVSFRRHIDILVACPVMFFFLFFDLRSTDSPPASCPSLRNV